MKSLVNLKRSHFAGFFGNPEFKRGPAGQVLQGAPPGSAVIDLAEILELKPGTKYRAKIRLLNGSILSNVRLPGPAFSKTGKLHGVKSGFKKNQMIVVGFQGGNPADPFVLCGTSFSISDLTKNNLGQENYYDPEIPEIGHESGYRLSFQDDLLCVIDSDHNNVLEMDFAAKELRLLEGWVLKVGALPSQSIVAPAYVTTTGYMAAPGGVSAQAGSPTPGVLLAVTVTATNVTGSTDVVGGGKSLAGHTHNNNAPAPGPTSTPL